MKYLEARKAAGKDAKPSVGVAENKMQRGNRLDQKDPQSLISSPRASKGPTKMHDDIQKLADELHIDVMSVTGTGVNGAVTEKDIRAYHRAKMEAANR